MGLPLRDSRHHSYGEYLSRPEDVRYELIGGEADEAVDTLVQPDLTVVCDPEKIDRRGCRGAPDWVVEVLSPATAAHDQTVKLSAYEHAGVPECWFAHPTDCIVTVYRLADGRYGRPSISELTGTLACQSVDIVTIDWDRMPRPPGGAYT